jgi:hypothetical protein
LVGGVNVGVAVGLFNVGHDENRGHHCSEYLYPTLDGNRLAIQYMRILYADFPLLLAGGCCHIFY